MEENDTGGRRKKEQEAEIQWARGKRDSEII